MSKFDAVFTAKREPFVEDTPTNQEKPDNGAESDNIGLRKRGRPNAKRSDPAFVQTTAYIRKETHRDVKLALLQGSDERDFSELVEELLSAWLQNRR